MTGDCHDDSSQHLKAKQRRKAQVLLATLKDPRTSAFVPTLNEQLALTGIPQKDIAKALHVVPSALTNYTKNARTMPIEMIIPLVAFLKWRPEVEQLLVEARRFDREVEDWIAYTKAMLAADTFTQLDYVVDQIEFLLSRLEHARTRARSAPPPAPVGR